MAIGAIDLSGLTNQVAQTEGIEASATALINGFAAAITKAVTDALTADNAADQASVDAANAAIEAVRARFEASSKTLGDAVAANSGGGTSPRRSS